MIGYVHFVIKNLKIYAVYFRNLFLKEFLKHILHEQKLTKNNIFFGLCEGEKLFTIEDLRKLPLYFMILSYT